ncbi:helix-turn-helix transcriptional regulator [Tissierella sp. Yu-01]|uniref:helix-turn-helix transcriptional regulator n=1 Tax=Tissierella sp. Yu-01 TaxID=3035694 RepID=UPI00240E014F|nr:helix-turn-helix transcriptional regulator [Tissierella sp. Yu-01]WFA10426.1 helix-turn-helix transcriptional regulator [Tissierella sp. Yu-01]
MQLSERQEKIIQIVKDNQPITSEAIAAKLKLTRATLRPDLAILTMVGILDARPKVGYFMTGKTKLSYVSDTIKDIYVKDVMSVPVVLEEETTLYDAIVFMFLEDVGSIYITNGGFLTGVVSRKDLLRNAIGGSDLHKVPVGVIMTRMPNVIYITQEDSILSAAIKIIEHEIDGLPVVEEVDGGKNLKVIGRISKTTITRLFVELGNNL